MLASLPSLARFARAARRQIRATRQHHAIEHATLHVLARQSAPAFAAGISDPDGFTLLGDIDRAQAERAVHTALTALQEGQSHLAIHPHCGTNLLTQALLCLSVTRMAWRARGLGPVPTAMLAVTGFMGVIETGKALGAKAQTYTTLSDVEDRQVREIFPVSVLGRRCLRVRLTARS